jgi:acid phosphatase family membrane protein YuiD
MFDIIGSRPFMVAIAAGAAAQAVKVLSFLIVEKRVNYRRFVQTDGSPNMHSAAMSALTLFVGSTDGFESVAFSLSFCLTLIVMVDTYNVKQAHSKQQEVVLMLLDRMSKKHASWVAGRKALSYTPMDVFSGAVLGIVIALLLA